TPPRSILWIAFSSSALYWSGYFILLPSRQSIALLSATGETKPDCCFLDFAFPQTDVAARQVAANLLRIHNRYISLYRIFKTPSRNVHHCFAGHSRFSSGGLMPSIVARRNRVSDAPARRFESSD